MNSDVQPGGAPENDPGRLIYVYKNGERFKNYKRYVVNRKTVKSLDYLYNELTKLLEPSFGAVRSLRTPTRGRPVHSVDEIEGGRSYVAVGNSRFVRLPYEKSKGLAEFSVPGIVKPATEDNYGRPRPLSIKPVKHSRIIASGKVKKDPGDSFFIHIYINGDDLAPAHKVRLVPPERTSMAATLNAVGKKVQTLSGAVLRLYTLNGDRVRSADEIHNGSSYVAVGREKQFHPAKYGRNMLPVWHAGTHILQTPTGTVAYDKLINDSPSINQPPTINGQTHHQPRKQGEGPGQTGSRLSHHYQNSSYRASHNGSTFSLHEQHSPVRKDDRKAKEAETRHGGKGRKKAEEQSKTPVAEDGQIDERKKEETKTSSQPPTSDASKDDLKDSPRRMESRVESKLAVEHKQASTYSLKKREVTQHRDETPNRHEKPETRNSNLGSRSNSATKISKEDSHLAAKGQAAHDTNGSETSKEKSHGELNAVSRKATEHDIGAES